MHQIQIGRLCYLLNISAFINLMNHCIFKWTLLFMSVKKAENMFMQYTLVTRGMTINISWCTEPGTYKHDDNEKS